MKLKDILEQKLHTNRFSIVKFFREKEILNNEIEMAISSLSLEDLIAVKLELSAQTVKGKMFFNLMSGLKPIIESATIKAILSIANSKFEAATMLGVTVYYFKHHLLPKYPELNNLYYATNKTNRGSKPKSLSRTHPKKNKDNDKFKDIERNSRTYSK